MKEIAILNDVNVSAHKVQSHLILHNISTYITQNLVRHALSHFNLD